MSYRCSWCRYASLSWWLRSRFSHLLFAIVCKWRSGSVVSIRRASCRILAAIRMAGRPSATRPECNSTASIPIRCSPSSGIFGKSFSRSSKPPTRPSSPSSPSSGSSCTPSSARSGTKPSVRYSMSTTMLKMAAAFD